MPSARATREDDGYILTVVSNADQSPAELLARDAPGLRAELALAGPAVTSIADDPEAASTLNDVIALWRQQPHSLRQRVHLACLPVRDLYRLIHFTGSRHLTDFARLSERLDVHPESASVASSVF